MAEITLVAETGRVTGSRSSNRLRGDGRIPAVVYGHGMTPVSIAVDRREVRHALSTSAGLNAVIDLKLDGDTHPTVVKQLQRDPVRRTVTHIDFQVVNLNEEITVDVPIVLEGEARGVLQNDGLVEQGLNTLSVSTTPRNIPDNITYDVSDLQIGDVVRVSDLALPDGVTSTVDPETPVVSGVFVAVEAEPEVEAAEGEEGAEGEAAAGEAGSESSDE
jgi:large subunit ribosomal protein L25